jgi:hypothetical protein
MRLTALLFDPGRCAPHHMTKGLECYIDADFAGGWSQADTENAENVLSQTDYVIIYVNCPIHWVNYLQTEIALIMAEVEFIAISQALQDIIPLITLLKEIIRSSQFT